MRSLSTDVFDQIKSR